MPCVVCQADLTPGQHVCPVGHVQVAQEGRMFDRIWNAALENAALVADEAGALDLADAIRRLRR